MSVGENIKIIRESKGIDLANFSMMTGISLANCEGIEAGVRALTSAEVQAICNALGVSFDALVAAPLQDAPESEGSVVMPVDELQNLLGKMRE